MPKPSTRKQNSTHWAVWTIALGVVLACFMPWALTHLYTGITFPATSHISDNIGGIAGPILNFVGLLVVYFSLREQFNANQIQLRNFKKASGAALTRTPLAPPSKSSTTSAPRAAA